MNVFFAILDRDFAGYKDTSCTMSSYMILMKGGVVAYYSGSQSIAALCTYMAETIARAKLIVEVKHTSALILDFQCRKTAGESDKHTMRKLH